jgi:uncharacterized protein YmfQ (DUF2313 family)
VTTLNGAGPGIWTAPDGYRVVRQAAEDGWVSWQVYRPGQTKTGANVTYLSEARDVIEAWRLTNGECAWLRLVPAWLARQKES